jgi:hypothetical protein
MTTCLFGGFLATFSGLLKLGILIRDFFFFHNISRNMPSKTKKKTTAQEDRGAETFFFIMSMFMMPLTNKNRR